MSIRKIKRRHDAAMGRTVTISLLLPFRLIEALRTHRSPAEFISRALEALLTPKMLQQIASPLRAEPWDVLELRAFSCVTATLPMSSDRKPMRLIPNLLQEV